MPEKVTSPNGLKVTSEYFSHNVCQGSVELSNHRLIRNVHILKRSLRESSRSGLFSITSLCEPIYCFYYSQIILIRERA